VIERGGMWLACALAVGLVGANVAVKPGLAPVETRRVSDGVRRSREWRGRVAPPFELPLLDGGRVRSEAPESDVTVLVFVTTWCDECGDEMTEMRSYQQRLQAEGLRVRVVVIDTQERADDVRAFARRHDLPTTVAIDESGDVMRAYEVRTFPTMVIVARDGRARLFHEGPVRNADVVIDPVVRVELGIGRAPQP
jgi:peroxiredoxin